MLPSPFSCKERTSNKLTKGDIAILKDQEAKINPHPLQLPLPVIQTNR
jgi:hypothetical protein